MIHLFRKKQSNRKSYKLNSGFTIAELIVVIAIFGLVTSVALFNQGRLSSNVLLTNMTYEVGLAVREAQVYGLGAKNLDGSDNADSFLGEYGVHFSIDNPQEIYLFGNNYSLSDNPAYDPGEELFQYQFQNQRGNKITALCVGDIDTTNGERCTNDENNPYMVTWVDVIFKRPNPAPIIYANNSAGPALQTGRVYIVINNSENTSCRTVIVEGTGQIRVEDSNKTNPTCTNAS